MLIRNYTVYSSEDIQLLYTEMAERDAQVNNPPTAVHGPGGSEVVLVVVYWRGRQRQPLMNVREGCDLDPERRGHVLRIKRPGRLSMSPIEKLASCSDEQSYLPAGVVTEITRSLSYLFGCRTPRFFFGWKTPIARVTGHVRILDTPDLIESVEEQKRRVGAKKIRWAINRAITAGRRRESTLEQLTDGIDRMTDLKRFLSDEEKALLAALRVQRDAMAEVKRITEKLLRSNT